MSRKTLARTTLVLAAFAAVANADASSGRPNGCCRVNLTTHTLDALHREVKVVDADGARSRRASTPPTGGG